MHCINITICRKQKNVCSNIKTEKKKQEEQNLSAKFFPLFSTYVKKTLNENYDKSVKGYN